MDAAPVTVYIAQDSQALYVSGNRLAYEWLWIPEGTNLTLSAPGRERHGTFKVFKGGKEIPPADMPPQMSAAGIEINDCELDLISAGGEIRHILGNARPLRDEQGNLRRSISAFIDITERKKAEEALKKAHNNLEVKIKERTAELEETYKSLKESERSFTAAQKMAHIGNWEWDRATDKAYWSDELYRIFRHNPQESAPPYEEFLSYFHPKDRDYMDKAHKKALNGEAYSLDLRIVLPDEEERTIHIQSEIIPDENNIPIRLTGIVQDITERKKAEEKIQILANIVESSNDAIITESLDGIIISWNQGAEQMYGYSFEEVVGKNVSILEPDNTKGETKLLIEKVKQGENIQRYETSSLRKDGTTIYVSMTFSSVFNTDRELVAISVIARDITKRIEVEKSLAKAEDARKKEIHHRIKNNLQVISSLLDLQAEKFDDTKVVEAFRESQNRVISMALIHEELHKGAGAYTLDFSAYIRELAENLFQTYRLCSKNIHLYLDLEENTFFNMDTAVPLGIIVNELISNSLKHAFIGQDKGEILIKLQREEKQESKKERCKRTSFILTVKDNGIGISENINLESLDSLGMQLVTSLVDQLDGEFELKKNNGTEFIMRFTLIEKSNQELAPAIQ